MKFQWATNPNGWFKRAIGVLLIIAGIAIIGGYDRDFQQFIIDQGVLDITQAEHQLLGK